MTRKVAWALGLALLVAIIGHDLLITSGEHATDAWGSVASRMTVSHGLADRSDTHGAVAAPDGSADHQVESTAGSPCFPSTRTASLSSADYGLPSGSLSTDQIQIDLAVVTSAPRAPQSFTQAASTRRALLQVFLN